MDEKLALQGPDLKTYESVTLNSQGEVIARSQNTTQVYILKLSQGISLELASIPGGIFYMGSAEGQGYVDETPRHQVWVASFLMGIHLVTQMQWKAVMNTLPSCRFSGDDLPVEYVSWKDAQLFCARLSKKTGKSCRLPSEAQWEYACRAGTRTPFFCGETITTEQANYVGEHTYLQESKGIYRHTTTPVGSFLPNPFGLYDMSGNLWEWCADAWHENYQGAPVTSSIWDSSDPSTLRVARGGSWHEIPNHCRSAVRVKFDPDKGDEQVGFRITLSLE
jgi:formylglycine-generating enzyme required for sulfatase activity